MVWQVLVGPIANLAKQWLKNRGEKSQAKHTKKIREIEQVQSWEELAMKNAGSSWKDEYLTLIFSIPLILAFFPTAVPFVMSGFEALKLMPEWYQYTLSIIVAASFGVRSAIGWKRAKLSREVVEQKVIKDENKPSRIERTRHND